MSLLFPDVVVVGGGAIGSAVALTLARRGMATALVDDAPVGANASGVAAGMLAPAFEAALDPLSETRFDLFREARDLWPAFADGVPGVALNQAGAIWRRQDEDDDMALRLERLGAARQVLSPKEAGSLEPGLAAPHGAVFTSDDWRLEPGRLLLGMRSALAQAGGRIERSTVTALEPGGVRLASGAAVRAGVVVLATGAPPPGLGMDPLRALLQPIKGQALVVAGGQTADRPTLRARGVYVCRGAEGTYVGATMEEGVCDSLAQPETLSALRDRAQALVPALAKGQAKPMVGVRWATSDGLPLVGKVGTGMFAALGARRNGWLLAPMIAGMLADQIVGGAGGARAADFDPARVLSRSG